MTGAARGAPVAGAHPAAAGAQTRALVIGIGNAYRGDDAAGLAVAAGVRAARRPGVEAIEFEGEPVSLLETWDGAGTVYLADAVWSGEPPGQVHRFDVADGMPPEPLRHRGTHTFSVGDTIELARAVGRLPPRLIVYGIEGGTFETGVPLTLPVQTAVAAVVSRVLAELAAHGGDS